MWLFFSRFLGLCQGMGWSLIHYLICGELSPKNASLAERNF
jgi:hypothetical protein